MQISFSISRKDKELRSAPADTYPDYFPQGNLQQFYNWLTSGMSDKKTSSGEAVDQESSLKFSAVFSCVRILAETIACLPFNIYHVDDNGNKNIDYNHPIAHLIGNEPNSIMTSFIFRETMMAHLCLWGNAYAKIIRDNKYRVTELQLINPAQINPKLVGGRILYAIKGEKKTWNQDDILHIPALGFDGIKGKSPIEVHAEAIGLGLGLQRYGAEFFANGTTMSGVFEHPGKLSDPAYQRLKTSLAEQHTGVGNRHKSQVLEEGMKWSQMTIAPEAAQFILSRKFQINEIARAYRVPPHMMMDLDRATFSNIEHQGIEFVQNTILPWCKRIEQEFNRKLLTEKEKPTTFTKLNLMGLMRGDAVARTSYYKNLFDMGAVNANEIRAMEDMNGIGPEGEKYYVMTNLGDTAANDKNPKANQPAKEVNPPDPTEGA